MMRFLLPADLDATVAMYISLGLAACALALAGLVARSLRQSNRRPRAASRAFVAQRPIALFGQFLRKNQALQQSERLDRQLEAVMRPHVTFSKTRVMNGGEYGLFRAALNVTRQSMPSGSYPFYVFPQVSLGQIIRAHASLDWHADQAHRAINSKRCDLLIANRSGNPVAVLEYQGAGHNIGGTAGRRDTIKRIALERAGIRFVEIADGTTEAEMQRIIRDLLGNQAGCLDAPTAAKIVGMR